MRTLIFAASLMLLTTNVLAQSNYEIKLVGSTYTESQIINAFSNANFCGKHFISERRKIIFSDGSVVELFSSDECVGMNVNCFIDKPTGFNPYDSSWEISSTGSLVERIAINPTK